MYVCVCNAVTESQIRDTVCEGKCSLGQLRACLGVAAECGKCAPMAQQVLHETLREMLRAMDLRAA